MTEPRTDNGIFLRNGLLALGFEEADANEQIIAIEEEAANPAPGGRPSPISDPTGALSQIVAMSASPAPAGLDAPLIHEWQDEDGEWSLYLKPARSDSEGAKA